MSCADSGQRIALAPGGLSMLLTLLYERIYLVNSSSAPVAHGQFQERQTVVFVVIGVAAAIVTIAIGVSGGVRWIYRNGQESGQAQAEREADRRAQAEAQAKIQAAQSEAQAKIQAVEAKLVEIQGELDFIRARRPRT